MQYFQYMVEFPVDKIIIHSIITNRIKINSLRRRDVELAIDILGSSKYIVQGKTTRHRLEPVNVSL